MNGTNKPLHGNTYIYIYIGYNNNILYVGQTFQDICKRYKQHIRANNAGARLTNHIYYFKVPSVYSDYIEGYLGYYLQGKYQGCLPNHTKDKWAIPDDDLISNIDDIIYVLQNKKKHKGIRKFFHPGFYSMVNDLMTNEENL